MELADEDSQEWEEEEVEEEEEEEEEEEDNQKRQRKKKQNQKQTKQKQKKTKTKQTLNNDLKKKLISSKIIPEEIPETDFDPPTSGSSISLDLIDQCYDYSSQPLPCGTYTVRRSLFHDHQWIQDMIQEISPPKAISMQKWLEQLPFIQFPKTDFVVQKKSNSNQLRLSPYSSQQFSSQNSIDDDINLSSSKPMPKKKTGKKARIDNSNEHYKTIMQIYEKNQYYLHGGGTINGIHFSEVYLINIDQQTLTKYFLVCTSGIGWYGDVDEASLPIPPHLYHMGVGYDYPHEVADSTSPYSQTPNMLQIYEVVIALDDPVLETNSQILSVKLAYCIGFSSIGPIWDAKWCPEDSFQQLTVEDTVLGTVALVSADGKCRVLVLPMPHAIRKDSVLESQTSAFAIPEALRDVPLLLESELCRWELTLPSECALSVAWGGGNGGQGKDGIVPLLLACGLSTGSIAIWNLSLPSLRHSVLEANEAQCPTEDGTFDKKLVRPIIPLLKLVDMAVRVGNTATSNSRAIVCGVRALSFCPYAGELLASGGYDGPLKVWHIHEKFCPIYTRDHSGPWLYALEWNKNGCGIMWASAGGPTVNFDQLWLQESHSTRHTLYNHPSLFSGVNKIVNFSDEERVYLNLACSISSDGSLVGVAYPLYKKGKRKVDSLQYYRILDVTMQEECIDIPPPPPPSSSSSSSVAPPPAPSTTIDQGYKIQKYCEILIDDEIKENKCDLSSKISSSTVALLGFHAMELPNIPSLQGFHLMACGGQAGLLRLQLFHSACFHPRIQLFQNTGS